MNGGASNAETHAKNAKHAFDSYDIDGDGEITYEELVGGMGGEYSANEISAIFAMGDTDQDGKISFLEFSKIMIPTCQDTLTKFWKCFRNVQGVRETFKKFDADGDAQISRQEVIQGAAGAGMKMSADEVDTLFILGDKNGDGAIDFAEFAEIRDGARETYVTNRRADPESSRSSAHMV